MDFPEDYEAENPDENYDYANLEELNKKSLTEVLEESNRKVCEKAK